MAGGNAYSLPGQTDADGDSTAAPSAEVMELLPAGLRANRPSALSPILVPPPEPEPELTTPSSAMLHVRGIGADGWDGTPDGKGDYENEAALKMLFQPFGDFRQATIRHRITDGQNTSWALVTMGNAAAVDSILQSHAEAPIFAGNTKLVLNRFSQTQAKLSTGGMANVRQQDAERRTWPQWLKSAKVQYPKMQVIELQSLRSVFERHAIRGRESELVVTRSAMGSLLEEAMHQIFDAIDADHSGELERDEVRDLMRMLGRKLGESQLTAVFTELDEDGNGNVDYSEFKKWWDKQEYQSKEERDIELRDLFDIVDTDSSGEIDWEEFLELISFQMLSASEYEARSKRCFLRPDGALRKRWDLVQVIMLIYVASMVPLRIGFDREAELWTSAFVIEVIVDIYFVVDIGVQFRSAYYDDKELITDSRKIAGRYMRTWFPIDFVSCLPINYVQLIIQAVQEGSTGGNSSEAKLFKIFRLLRLAKLLRLARMQRLLERLKDEYEGLAQFMEMSKITLTIFYVAHFVACFWYLVGDGVADVVGYTTVDSHCNDAGTDCLPAGVELYDTFEGAGADSENGGAVLHGWVKRNGWDVDKNDPNLWTRYLDCFYFSVTTLTTVGYGDKTPFTNAEKVFAILCELAGCIIFGIIAGSLSSVAMTETLAEQEKKVQRARLQEFLRHKRVSPRLQAEVISQMDNFFETKSVFDEQEILDRLPPKHRKALLMEMYRTHLQNCPLMRGMEEGVVTKLCLKMRPYLALEDDVVVREGEVGEEMYMIIRGTIRLQSISWRLYNERSWQDGAFFGELTVLGIGAGAEHNRHVYSATAATNTECVFITQDSMDTLQILHPTFKTRMREMAVKRAERFGYGGRADHVYAPTPEKNDGSNVESALDESLDRRREAGSMARSGSFRERSRTALSGPSVSNLDNHNRLQEQLLEEMPSTTPPGPQSKTLELHEPPLEASTSEEIPSSHLLQELIRQNVELAVKVNYLTDQMDSLVRRSSASPRGA